MLMLSQTELFLIGLALGLLSCGTFGIARGIWWRLRTKDRYVARFVSTASFLMESPDVPEVIKDFIEFFSQRIDDREFARVLIETVEDIRQAPPSSPLLQALATMDDDMRVVFYEASANLFMAASFAHRDGRRFRDWFTGRLVDHRLVRNEVQVVYEAEPAMVAAAA